MTPRRGRKPPWYHRISWVTWSLLAALALASLSLAIGVSRQAGYYGPLPQVQVLNGCGASGLARRVAEKLRDEGVDVVSVGNADSQDYAETLVLLRRGDISVARRVARLLGGGVPLEQLDPTLLIDVTVILGHDVGERFGGAAGDELP